MFEVFIDALAQGMKRLQQGVDRWILRLDRFVRQWGKQAEMRSRDPRREERREERREPKTEAERALWQAMGWGEVK